MRHVSAAERRLIADTLIQTARERPRFHLYFFRDDHSAHSYRFAGYKGLGVMVSSRYKNDNNHAGLNQIFVTQPDFLQQYTNFYLHSLLPRYTCAPEESLLLLKKLRGKI